ncbi:hypothetical protein GCM10023200_26860 [Actinomycetospora chlora]|uniref:Uncharacterized protein n=1 Tax=Actinomycetospora chlora TaxID=663608 RepID=A0ABP9B8C4_9PSEU
MAVAGREIQAVVVATADAAIAGRMTGRETLPQSTSAVKTAPPNGTL